MSTAMPQIIEVTKDEQAAQEILQNAADWLPDRECTWDDYEAFKRRLQAPDLTPEQYALCCGMLAKVMGL